MTDICVDAFRLTADEIRSLLRADVPLLPELEAARADPAALRDAPQTKVVLARTETYREEIAQIPQTSYTDYRAFKRRGDRPPYEAPYFLKRARLSAAVLRLFLGDTQLKDSVQDYLWNLCEESNWVVPAHEDRAIDLFAAETGFLLGETLLLLGETLDTEVRHRVRQEVERRIFDTYLRQHHTFGWYKGHNNWNGVCNSSVAATFLLLEPEPGRVAQALALALAGLRVFVDTAFEADGSSTEGVSYWHYGLHNFVALAEMLRARTGGAIDLLASDRMRQIAAYPSKVLLSGAQFASFSDCDETVTFHPGVLARLAERTGERSLLGLIGPPGEPMKRPLWRLPMLLRSLLWWDGRQHAAEPIEDAILPVAGVARLVARSEEGTPIVLAVKAGHNGEQHNQNDVGSFLLHVDGENLLTDPGRGLYSRAYFSDRRYENIFANSYGHSVPRIGGRLQGAGRQFAGALGHVETTGPIKRAQLDLAGAYPVEGLARAERQILVAAEGEQAGTVWLDDAFGFSDRPEEVEEAFITWLEVDAEGATAVLRGQQHALRLTIESPAGAAFRVERLEKECIANNKPGVLKRLSFVLPASREQHARVRMQLLA